MNPVRNVLILVLVLTCSVGCVSAEGIGLTSQPYIGETLTKHGRLADGTHSDDASESRTDISEVVVVGTVSAFREITAKEAEKEYENYAKGFESWGSTRNPDLTFEAFSASMKGWTKVKILGIPLVGALYAKALVPKNDAENVDFEPALATFLFQSSSDLVAARTNSDGALVVEALLCKDQTGYQECVKRYKMGIFDGATGNRLNSRLEVKDRGPHIDPFTFERRVDTHIDDDDSG